MNKKQILIYVGIAVGAVAGNLGGQWLMKPDQKSIQKEILAGNAQLPVKVDDLTMLNKMSFEKDVLVYHMQVLALASEYPDFKEIMTKQLDRTICAKDASKRITKMFQLQYRYVDKENKALGVFNFDKGFCP